MDPDQQPTQIDYFCVQYLHYKKEKRVSCNLTHLSENIIFVFPRKSRHISEELVISVSLGKDEV